MRRLASAYHRFDQPARLSVGMVASPQSRLRFAQDAHFVFRGVATPLGSGHDFGVRMRGGRLGFGWDWRSTALRLATLASASFRASPGP